MADEDFNPDEKDKLQKKITEAKKDLDEAISKVDMRGIDSLSINDVQTFTNEINVLANELKKRTDNFSQVYLSLIELNQISIVERRLAITNRLRELRNLYNQFNFYYGKNAREREFVDIFRYVKLYDKLKDELNKYSKIAICNKMSQDIDQKIQNSVQIVIDTIQHKKCENLTTTDIFQLIIISTSPYQFWDFFNFLSDDNFNFKDPERYKNKIEIFFNFYEKTKKISPLLKQAQLENYISSIDELRNRFETKVLSSIKNFSHQDKNNLNILCQRADQLLELKNSCFFSEKFQNYLQDNIQKFLRKFLDGMIVNLQYHVNEFIMILIKVSQHFQKFAIQPEQESEYIGYIINIFNKKFSDIYKDDESKSFLVKIRVDMDILFKNLNGIKIQLFSELFIQIINIQLSFVQFVLSQLYARKAEKQNKSDNAIPKEAYKDFINRSYPLINKDISNFDGYVINNILKNPLFQGYSHFYKNLPVICPRLFYKVDMLEYGCNVLDFIDCKSVESFANDIGADFNTLLGSIKNSAEEDRPSRLQEFFGIKKS